MRAIAILAALAMITGLFLPWLNPQTTGIGFTPWDLVKDLDPTVETVQNMADTAPELLGFLATFALAGLFCLLAILGAPSRALALITGGGAVAMLVYAVIKMRDQAAAVGIPMPDAENMADYAARIPDLFGTGAMAWAGGALLLLLCGLIGFPSRR
jgi:hypothetical protein